MPKLLTKRRPATLKPAAKPVVIFDGEDNGPLGIMLTRCESSRCETDHYCAKRNRKLQVCTMERGLWLCAPCRRAGK